MDSLQIAEHVVEQIKAGTQKGENLEKIVIQLLADDFKNLDWISASEIVLKEQVHSMNRNSKGHFQKGHQLGGRPKGSRNRFTLAMMDELMQGEDGQLDFHPMLEAKKLYRATDDDRIRVALLKEMLSFGNDKQFTEPEQPEVEEISDDAMKEVYEALKQRFG